MNEPRRWRWHGRPDEPLPDAGDVLQYTTPDRADWFHLVHYATQVRGRPPYDLWLVVTRHDLLDGYGIPTEVVDAIDGGATVIRAEVRRRRRARR